MKIVDRVSEILRTVPAYYDTEDQLIDRYK